MKKYRINWWIVLRNISILLLITSCYAADKQLENNDKEMQLLDEHIRISQIASKHSLKSKLNHKTYSYISVRENEAEIKSEVSKDNKIYLGKFKITHYCACKKCCGPNAQGITASGAKVKEGVTIAVDRKVIKLGSKVYIDGYGERIAQDTGSAIKGNKIDVYIADHQRALQMGVTYKDVYLMR